MHELLTFERNGEIVTAILAGEIPHHRSCEIAERLREIDYAGVSRLNIDMARCNYISSGVVGALVAAQREAAAQGVSVRLLNASPITRHILETADVLSLFQ